MNKTLLPLSLALVALSSQGGAQQNLAYRRAAYQSSAADYNRVAHLVTDGVLTEGAAGVESPYCAADEEKSPDNERPAFAFDGDPKTKWLHFGARAWLQVRLEKPAKPAAYALVSANDDAPRDPKDFRLLGSDDGETFETLDEQSGQDFESRFQRRKYPLAPKRAYRWYRLDVSANHGDKGWGNSGTRLQLGEFDLLDAEGQSLVRPKDASAKKADYVSAWASRTGKDEWVFVDLGEGCTFGRVTLDWCKTGWAKAYDVQVSDDARAWRTVASEEHGKGGHEEVSFAKTSARYVRLFCRVSSSDRFALSELGVIGETTRAPYALAAQPAPPADGSLRLTGGNWRLCRASEVKATGEALTAGSYDDAAWLPATVPGTALTSFLNAGAIPDMNFADNQLMISESYFTTDFWYRNTFAARKPKAGERVWLNFEAINWKADVYLNGRSLGRIDGGFIRRSFDITDVADYAGANRLAVLIRGNDHPGAVTLQDLQGPGGNGGVLGRDNPTIHASIGWDWVPTVRGRNVGIYRDVTVTYSGDVTLADGWAITTLDVEKKDFSSADVTLRVRATNASAKPVTAKIEAAVTPPDSTSTSTSVSTSVTLAAGEAREVTVGSFRMAKPRVWWPATYGDQPLYAANLKATVGGRVSAAHDFRFGVRTFTYKTDKPLQIFCNGTRIVCRGGNWGMDDANLAATPADYDTKVRLHAEANLTMIRNWVGMVNSKDFYDACDKYGVLVWDDFWLANPSDGPNPDDPAMFLANARDKILKNRHHASIPLYCGRNEGNPPPTLFDALPALVNELDGTRHYIPHSAGGTVSGFGPYSVRDPKWYFANAPETLHSERGQPNVPEIETMRAMLGPDHLWPQDNVWGQHDFCMGGAMGCKGFNDYIAKSFAAPQDLETFTRYAQAAAYENHKAMFESVYTKGGNGILMWMSQSAWPSMVWQTYDYWHDVNGGYFGAKAGNQPVNVILNQSNRRFWAVNATARPFKGSARIEIRDVAGRSLFDSTQRLSLASDARQEILHLPESPEDGLLLIRATVAGADGARLAENFTWFNVRDERKYQELLPLLKSNVTLSGFKAARTGRTTRGAVTVANRTDRPQLLVRVRLVDADGRRVLPVHWSDNYLNLFPGESRTVTFEATGDVPSNLRAVVNLCANSAL